MSGSAATLGRSRTSPSPNIDTERDYLFDNLQATGGLLQFEVVDDFHKVREGRNGGGDPWHTDGRLFVGAVAKTK